MLEHFMSKKTQKLLPMHKDNIICIESSDKESSNSNAESGKEEEEDLLDNFCDNKEMNQKYKIAFSNIRKDFDYSVVRGLEIDQPNFEKIKNEILEINPPKKEKRPIKAIMESH